MLSFWPFTTICMVFPTVWHRIDVVSLSWLLLSLLLHIWRQYKCKRMLWVRPVDLGTCGQFSVPTHINKLSTSDHCNIAYGYFHVCTYIALAAALAVAPQSTTRDLRQFSSSLFRGTFTLYCAKGWCIELFHLYIHIYTRWYNLSLCCFSAKSHYHLMWAPCAPPIVLVGSAMLFLDVYDAMRLWVAMGGGLSIKNI